LARIRLVALTLSCLSVAGVVTARAQAPASTAPKVDFANDIQPLFREECVGCHGPKKQNGGMRLDRRSSAMKALTRRIVPGNSANSMVYHRVSDAQFGQPMPPTGELKPEQVAMIQAWIDQGAEWPDALANEVELPPLSNEAIALVDMLHEGKLAEFMKTVTAKPALLNARGPEGSTPFMYAVTYTDPVTIARLIKLGADVNAHNDANGTALMWAAHDLAKTRLLVAHGAEVNVLSADFRTPLMIAARKPGGEAIVKLLLEHGANTMPNVHPDTASSPLLEAATAGDAASFELLIQHGAKLKDDAEPALVMAVTTKCARCVELAVAQITEKGVYSAALTDTAFLNDTAAMRMMLEHGANPNARDSFGHSALLYSAGSDVIDVSAVKLLVVHGADVNIVDKHANSPSAGMMPLDVARRHGTTEIVKFLEASGAKEKGWKPETQHLRQTNDMWGAVQDSLPVLQRADVNFAKGAGCISCHTNSLTAMTMGMAKKQGFPVDEKVEAEQVKVNVENIAGSRDVLHEGFLVPVEDLFSDAILGYMLMGLSAEGYKADLNTDMVAMYLMGRQRADGSWPEPHADTRQPLCEEYIGQTAKAMRALQLYAPKLNAAAYKQAVARAAAWLAAVKSSNNDDRGWRLTGLAWAGTNPAAKAQAMRELLAAQKPDGGWSDLPGMETTAYATGKSLVALRTAGMAATTPAYKRGVAWLLAHQDVDGSWYVQSRAMAFQPDFDPGFPHGHDQFISQAGTNWAAMALTMALPEKKPDAGVKSSVGNR